MAEEGLTETVQDLIRGNHDIENSNNAIDNLKVHFKIFKGNPHI